MPEALTFDGPATPEMISYASSIGDQAEDVLLSLPSAGQ
jgi:hypothetical protein